MALYGKLNNGEITLCTFIPNVSNASQEALAQYAKEQGYKKIVERKQEHQYMMCSWKETAATITQLWTEMDIDDVKSILLEEVQTELNESLEKRVSIPCSLGFDIVYDTQAQMNVMGLIAFGQGGKLIDVNDEEHFLSIEELQQVAIALSEYKTELYNKAQSKREYIKDAQSIQELLSIVK